MYGTRDAGAIWEETYTKVLLDMGFTQGLASPCTFRHDAWGIALVIHGDDFTALGTDAALDRYQAEIMKHFDVDLRGRLGRDPSDCSDMKMLNRVVRVVPEGLAYEADPRHAELLARALGLEDCGPVGTPGIKDKNLPEELIADGQLPVERSHADDLK